VALTLAPVFGWAHRDILIEDFLVVSGELLVLFHLCLGLTLITSSLPISALKVASAKAPLTGKWECTRHIKDITADDIVHGQRDILRSHYLLLLDPTWVFGKESKGYLEVAEGVQFDSNDHVDTDVPRKRIDFTFSIDQQKISNTIDIHFAPLEGSSVMIHAKGIVKVTSTSLVISLSSSKRPEQFPTADKSSFEEMTFLLQRKR
jgi:hypothetical protein